MTARGIQAAATSDGSGRAHALRDRLSAREQEVLRLIATGSTDGEIAHVLFVSHHTVANHVRHIRAKLDVATRAAAVAAAAHQGLL